MTESQVYWLVKLDDIRDLLTSLSVPFYFVGVIGFIGLIFAVLSAKGVMDEHYSYSTKEENEHTRGVGKSRTKILSWVTFPILGLAIICSITSAMLPGTKQMAAIVVIPKIVNAASENEALKKMPNIILETANAWMLQMTPTNIKDGVKEAIQEVKKK